MKSFYKLAIAAALVSTLSACVYVDGNHHDNTSHRKAKEKRELISSLELKTPHSEVLTRLGKPYLTEALALENSEYRILYYVTDHDSDHFKNGKKTTPVIFKDGVLIGWGSEMLDILKK